MPIIQNPTPLTPGICAIMRITSLHLFFPSESTTGFLRVRFQPSDGSVLLASGSKELALFDLTAKRQNNAPLNAMLTSIVSEIQRQSGIVADPSHLILSLTDPASPVRIVVFFTNQTQHTIPDAYALAQTDPVFAGVFMGVMSTLAQLSGLNFIP